MAKFYRADEVFKSLPDETKENVFQMAAGKLVYFPSANRRQPVDRIAVCRRYAEGVSFGGVGEEFGVSRERAYTIVAEERAAYSKASVRLRRQRGMSLRGIARLYRKSHEAVRDVVGTE